MTTLLTVVEERDYPGHIPTGPIGRRLAARLLSVEEQVRVLAPSSEAVGWPAGVEIAAGDISRPEEVPSAFDGIERMFLAGAVPDTVQQAVRLARQGGVQRIAVLSSHGPEIEIEFGPDSWYWLAIEVVVERSGAQWTHLHPSPIMAQTLRSGYPHPHSDLAAAIRNHEVIREAYPDSEYPFIDEDDLAAIAVKVLFENGYAGQTLTVHGEPISLRDQLRLIGQALGRNVTFEKLTPEEAADRARHHGMDEQEVQEMLASEAERAASPPDPEYHRWVDLGIGTVARVLGRPPRSYTDWLVDNIDALR